MGTRWLTFTPRWLTFTPLAGLWDALTWPVPASLFLPSPVAHSVPCKRPNHKAQHVRYRPLASKASNRARGRSVWAAHLGTAAAPRRAASATTSWMALASAGRRRPCRAPLPSRTASTRCGAAGPCLAQPRYRRSCVVTVAHVRVQLADEAPLRPSVHARLIPSNHAPPPLAAVPVFCTHLALRLAAPAWRGPALPSRASPPLPRATPCPSPS